MASYTWNLWRSTRSCCGFLDVYSKTKYDKDKVLVTFYASSHAQMALLDDKDNKFKPGDSVEIIETKPFSKTKKFEVIY